MPAPTPASIAPARRVAFDVLRKVMRERGNSDTLLHSLQVDGLSSQDRNLCTTLVLGTLRWQRVLDAECRRFLARPDLTLSEDALLALRVGAYQLLFLDRIPAHAAIFESVEWVKHSEGARQAGLVNAVLRKVAALPKTSTFPAEKAYPEWMVARWQKFYGVEACQRICMQGQMEQKTTVRLLTPDAAEKLRSQEIALQPGAFLAKARILSSREAKHAGIAQTGETGAIENYASNRNSLLENQPYVQVQDEGSQLVAELVGKGECILDCCAAPGGKTVVLLENNPDARVLACDVHPTRLATMRRRLTLASRQDRIEFRVVDAARLTGVGPFDRILCDVPCTGTGTLAGNPEIRHRLQPQDLTRQAERQRMILAAALRLLAPGGRLLYSTCSLESEENEAVVEACLNSADNSMRRWIRLDLRAEFDRLEQEGIVRGEAVAELRATGFREGYLRTLPGLHPCDGFFAALIERRE
ncbi:MAG: transcription antitermination factor NusB [Terriglobia bacterium]|nr:transcription antitermination factor NusB [Terriglobia bacterium]